MDLDLLTQDLCFDSLEGRTALEIYAQDLFLSRSHTDIKDDINGLVNRVYFNESGVIGVTSVNFSEEYLGNIVLEYMAVDENKQGQGYGGAILELLKQEAREISGLSDGVLYVTVQSDTADFYVQNGAIEEDDGTVYFNLDD